jgi:arsenic resistance protein ArsH
LRPQSFSRKLAVLKDQTDWLPLEEAGVRPTQGRTLAVMQVSGARSLSM